MEHPVGRAEWAKVVTAWQRSGLAATEFCRRRGLSRRTFGWWRWRLGVSPAAAGSGFVAVKLENGVPVIAPSRSVFEIVGRKGHLVRVTSDFDAEALSRLMGVLEGLGVPRA